MADHMPVTDYMTASRAAALATFIGQDVTRLLADPPLVSDEERRMTLLRIRRYSEEIHSILRSG